MARFTYLSQKECDDQDALESAFRAHTKGAIKFSRRMAIAMADMFGETPRQIVLRLERRGLLKRGSWNWFAMNGGITKDHIAEAHVTLPSRKERF